MTGNGNRRRLEPTAERDVMSWQRPNIGSRVTREGHARFWERPEVKFLRATRHFQLFQLCPDPQRRGRSTSASGPHPANPSEPA